MGELTVRAGDKVPLNLQIIEGDADKYVRAIVKDPLGADYGLSPYVLTHVNEGLYSNNALSMPGLSYLTAQYQVFEDAGFTIRSTKYGTPLDIFLRKGIDLVESSDAELSGEITDTNLIGYITEELGTVSESTLPELELTGEISALSLTSTLESVELNGIIEDDELSTTLGCEL